MQLPNNIRLLARHKLGLAIARIHLPPTEWEREEWEQVRKKWCLVLDAAKGIVTLDRRTTK